MSRNARTNKHDVKIAKLRLRERILVSSIGAGAAIAVGVLHLIVWLIV